MEFSMTKKLFLMCLLGILTATSVYAADCPEGRWFENDGGKFCVPNFLINWWSAASWCQAAGMQLATIHDLCPNWTGENAQYKSNKDVGCNYLTQSNSGDKPNVWSATAHGSTHAKVLHGGAVWYEPRTTNVYFACKE